MLPETVITGFSRGGLGSVFNALVESLCDVGASFNGVSSENEVKERLDKAKRIEVASDVLPFLGMEEFKQTKVKFILRDPLRVINSLLFTGRFHNERVSTAYLFLSKQNDFSKYQRSPLDLACYYVLSWLKCFSDLTNDKKVFKVERDIKKICSTLESSSDNLFFLKPANRSGCKQKIKLQDLSYEFIDSIRTVMLQTGYMNNFWLPRVDHDNFINPDWHS